MEIVYVGELDRTKYAPDHLGIRQGLESFKGTVVDPVLNTPERCVEMIKDLKPDLIIHGNTDSLRENLGKLMRPFVKKQVFWMLDYQPNMDNYCWKDWNLEGYDAVFLSNKDQLKEWSDRFDCPAHYLTHGCVVMKPVRDQSFYHKKVFIGGKGSGGWMAERDRILEWCEPYDYINETGEAKAEVWKNMPAIYHTSDYVIDISHSWIAEGYASGRFFYSSGLGGCSLTKRFPGCLDLYPDDTKIYFDSPEELNEKINFYDRKPELRDKIKMKAWEHNKKHHNYELKFKEIISKC
jgi:hypothetical protein